MSKTKQNGYYELKGIGKTAHFSMNCWMNLKEERGKDFNIDLRKANNGSIIEQMAITADLIYSAILAYDQEEGNEIDYNIYKVRNWVAELSEDELKGFYEAMTASLQTSHTGKKKQTAKK